MATATLPAHRIPVADYVAGINAGDRALLARAITLVESTNPEHGRLAQSVLQKLLPKTGKAVRLGITGVPGVGKSTTIDQFGMNLIADGHLVAVLAIDPTSKRSGGSILGDKTRMNRLSSNESAYIRPSPSGGVLGGVARKTREAMLLCEAAGFDVIIVESVGVGQSEAELADILFDRLGLNKREAKEMVDDFFDELRLALERGESVKLSGFGNFQLRDKPQRPGRNPKTGEEIAITARRVVTFHASQKLKASVAALKGTPPGMNTIAYNTSKAAALHFARTLASEWGHYGIRVNAICPGFFPSKMASGLIEKLGPAMIERTPLRRIGGEEDLKGAVVFLASNASRHITGESIVVDGGASLI